MALAETCDPPAIASIVDFLSYGTTLRETSLNNKVESTVIFYLFMCFFRCSRHFPKSGPQLVFLLFLLVLIIDNVCLIIIELWGFKE